MSIKKILLTVAAGAFALGSSMAFAGGPGMMAPPAPVDYSGVYIEGDVGYASVNWSDFWAGVYTPEGSGRYTQANNIVGNVRSGGHGGFVWGGDLGYQFNRYFSAEAGWYKLPAVEGDQGLAAFELNSNCIQTRSWILYFAGKAAVPIWDNLDLFGKAGIVYRRLHYSGNALGIAAVTVRLASDAHYWAPFLAVGLQWWFSPEWSMNVQYLHVPSYTSAEGKSAAGQMNNSTQAPKADLILAGVGYKFAV